MAFTLALMRRRAIGVPFSLGALPELRKLAAIACAESLWTFDPSGDWRVEALTASSVNPVLEAFKATGHPGCVVFSSGSTGQPKGILHDFEKLLTKFTVKRTPYRTLLFLLIDHLGGINTLLSVLSQGGVGVVAENRTVDKVGRVVEDGRVELLPVTPAFLTLLVTSGTLRGYDFSSVKIVTYGTDTMHEQTLHAAVAALPLAKFQQTYGLSEVGVLRSKSKGSSSLMVRVGGAGFETRIVDGILHVRSESSMVGYLNAPSPFDADGWLNTGDAVEIDGEYLRILGRESDLINVGGQKVFPAEVENVILQADNVADVTVFADRHPLMGAVVCARVSLREPEAPAELRRRLRQFCLERLAPFKVPVRFDTSADQHSHRFKKMRQSKPATE
jgi:acyl-coenzyme A synthetase/AMP-(fatty) acid ligase